MKVDTVILNYTFGPEGQILSAWLEKFCKTVTVYFLLKAMKMVIRIKGFEIVIDFHACFDQGLSCVVVFLQYTSCDKKASSTCTQRSSHFRHCDEP